MNTHEHNVPVYYAEIITITHEEDEGHSVTELAKDIKTMQQSLEEEQIV